MLCGVSFFDPGVQLSMQIADKIVFIIRFNFNQMDIFEEGLNPSLIPGIKIEGVMSYCP